MLDYAQDNLSVVKLFIKNPYYTSIKRDLAMTQLDFIGNAGGLLGLCMGMSFISMFEIIYHCCNFAFHKIQVHVVPQ